MTDKRISNRPIEFGETEAFAVRIEPSVYHDPLGGRRFRAKKAKDVKDKDVEQEDLDALRWLREKRGLFEDGQAFKIQRHSQVLDASYTDEVQATHVTVEVPAFFPGASTRIYGAGLTLRAAVGDAKRKIEELGADVRTYPEFNTGLDRVLLKVGAAELRVADLCALIRDYYDDDNPCGGNLHCALDDGGMKGRIVSFDPNDKAAVLIAELLNLMSEDEREKLYERGYGR